MDHDKRWLSPRQAPSKQSGRVGTATRPAMSGVERVIRPRSPDMHVFLATGAPTSAPCPVLRARVRRCTCPSTGPRHCWADCGCATGSSAPSCCCFYCWCTAEHLMRAYCLSSPFAFLHVSSCLGPSFRASKAAHAFEPVLLQASFLVLRCALHCCCTAQCCWLGSNYVSYSETTRASSQQQHPEHQAFCLLACLLACLRAGRSASTQGTMDLG